MTAAGRALKRGIDLAVSAVGLLVLSPVLCLIALAIRADSPGPAFFRQERLGAGGVTFRIWKLRTMVQGAQVVLDDRGNVANAARDPRHTRLGRWLRRLSLDELPQLVNVLLGQMSLIGPRPDLPEALALYTAEERRKLEVRPGITGLAQASGRNALSAHEKWALDARYAREVSVALDLRILRATVGALLGRRGIYAGEEPPPELPGAPRSRGGEP
ncbi:MAG TPA: sugar transferase [Anaeromyxobacter sp.]|nr:sugar transferase [Anaeromyxobacter sp.]